MQSPRVSVFMPAYEPRREHIRAAVSSVIAQTFHGWTLLVNDDASVREPTRVHVEEFLADSRIRYQRNERNLGIGGNWNACWPQATGEYVAFLFHDDIWEPTYLERAVTTLDANPSVGFVAANHTYLQEGDVRTAPFYDALHAYVKANVQPGMHHHEKFLRWWLGRGLRPNVVGEPSFVVLRRSLMEQVGPFNEYMVQFLDSEYWARCLLRADWYYLPEVLGKFRVHPAGMSAVNERLGRGVFERLQTLQTIMTALPASERPLAYRALKRALAGMIGKYLTRRKDGRPIQTRGSGALRALVLQHPLLVLEAALLWAMGKAERDALT